MDGDGIAEAFRLDDGEHGVLPVFIHEFPGHEIALSRFGQAVIVALMGEGVKMPEGFDLFLHLLLFFLRNLIQVQLIAEGAGHGHVAAGAEGNASAGLVVRAGGYVRAHRADRIKEGGPVLDAQPVDRIRVVAAPDLRGVVEHGRVEPSAAAAAALQEDVGEAGKEAFHQIIYAEHIPVADLAGPFRPEIAAVGVADAPVHVPFHIIDLSVRQDVRHPFQKIGAHLGIGHVQNQLVASPVGLAAGNGQRPVGMGPVQVAVLGNHLRLKPEAEFHAHGVDLFGKSAQGAAKLLCVYEPVAQSAVVVVSFPEPAVVQHQHFDAEPGRLGGDGKELVLIKVKIGGLPVVDEDRAALMLPGASAHVLPQDAVIVLRQGGKAAGGIAQNRLRRREAFSGLQAEGEPVGMDPCLYSGRASLILLGRGGEVSAVCQAEAVAVSRVLVRLRAAQNHGRVVVMAGGAAHTSDMNAGPLNGKAAEGTFHGVPAGKEDHVIVSEKDIHVHGKGLFQNDGGLSRIYHLQRPGDDVGLLKNAVEELDPHV